MERKGELTSEQIIAIVLAIIGFIIILAFLTQFGTEDYSSDEICRLSVLSRATAAEALPGAQQVVPLQCNTKKICLTAKKDGKCTQFTGEKDVVNVQLPKVTSTDSQTEQATEISKVLAQSIYDCWNIMGQGKLDLFKNVKDEFLPSFTGIKSTCVVCSRVAISDDVSGAVLEKVDSARYMEKNVVPGKTMTYVEALTDGATSTYPQASDFKSEVKQDLEENGKDTKIVLSGTDKKEIAFLFMQIKTTSFGDLVSRQGQAVGFAAGSVFMMKPSTIFSAGRFLLTPQGFGATVIATGATLGLDYYSSWRDGNVALGYCGEFTTKDKAKEGCSLLQGIPYSVTDIRSLCGQIEGNI